MARRAGDAAAGMGRGAAHVKPGNRRAVIGVSKHGARRIELVEAEAAVKDVAADEAELALEVERRQDLAGDDRRLETRARSHRPCRSSDRRPSRAHRPMSARPAASARHAGRRATRHDAPGGSSEIVERRRDQHFDDRRASTSLIAAHPSRRAPYRRGSAQSRFPRHDARRPSVPATRKSSAAR